MAILIARSRLDRLDFDLDTALAVYASEMEAHRFTVDIPAPTADPFVVAVYRAGGYTIHEDRPAPEPQPPDADDIIAERERRLSLGFDYDFGDVRGVHRIGTTPADLVGWDDVSKLAGAMLALGDTTGTIPVVTDTGPVALTALEWQAVLLASAAFRQPIWAASFALQATDPIPADYADDIHWP